MEIINFGSGSKGNCYLATFENGLAVMLDCGVRLAKVQNSVNFNNVDLLFVSHEHRDHALNMESIKRKGVTTIFGGNRESDKPEEFELTSKKSKNEMKITLVPIKHGECDNRAIIVESGNECLLYATDFNVCEWNLSKYNFTHIIVECNYVEEVLREELLIREDIQYKLIRQFNTHMGLMGLICFLRPLNLEKVQGIYLVHKSENLGVPLMQFIMVGDVLESFGKDVYLAKSQGGFEFFSSRKLVHGEV